MEEVLVIRYDSLGYPCPPYKLIFCFLNYVIQQGTPLWDINECGLSDSFNKFHNTLLSWKTTYINLNKIFSSQCGKGTKLSKGKGEKNPSFRFKNVVKAEN